MASYYNEFDPYAAQWLRNLISAGEIPAGDVDERSITEVSPDDLRGYIQCHFFAGIGGWPLALRYAGWGDSEPVWTGSCPCQPFSTAGKQKGQLDVRHLWPAWFELIKERKPATVFGEQVAAAITHGWWDDVAADLEGEGYSCGAAVLPACSVGKPHKRDRLWFVANSSFGRFGGACERQAQQPGRTGAISEGDVADSKRSTAEGGRHSTTGRSGCFCQGRTPQEKWSTPTDMSGDCSGSVSLVANTGHKGLERLAGNDCGEDGRQEPTGHDTEELEWIGCPDGKRRPVKPGVRLLAYGFPNRVAAIKAGGNAIVPEEAARFITAFRGVMQMAKAHDKAIYNATNNQKGI